MQPPTLEPSVEEPTESRSSEQSISASTEPTPDQQRQLDGIVPVSPFLYYIYIYKLM